MHGFDTLPCFNSTLEDLDINRFLLEYRKRVIVMTQQNLHSSGR